MAKVVELYALVLKSRRKPKTWGTNKNIPKSAVSHRDIGLYVLWIKKVVRENSGLIWTRCVYTARRDNIHEYKVIDRLKELKTEKKKKKSKGEKEDLNT